MMRPIIDSLTKSFEVGPNPTIRLIGTSCDVITRTGAFGHVAVEVHKRARDIFPGRAQNAIDEMDVTFIQDGDAITIEAQQHGTLQTFFHERGLVISITVPDRSNHNYQLTSGDVTLSDVSGAFHFELHSGDVTLTDVECLEDSHFHTRSGDFKGDIVVATGKTLAIETSSGDIDGRLALGAEAKLRTLQRSGDFSGEITPEAGVMIEMQASSGDVRLALPPTFAAHVDTHAISGDVRIRGFETRALDSRDNRAQGTIGTEPTSTLSIATRSGDITISGR